MAAVACGPLGIVLCLALLGLTIAAPLTPQIELQDFFKWSLQPEQARPVSQHVWTSACAFVARNVNKISREIGHTVKLRVLVADPNGAMDMCGRRKWNEVQVRQPLDILKAFLDVLVQENLITSKDVVDYTGHNPEPVWLAIAGPSAAGRSNELAPLMAAALDDDKRLSELPIFISWDDDALKGLIVKAIGKWGGPQGTNNRATLFLCSCGVSFSTFSRSFELYGMRLTPVAQPLVDDIYGPPKQYRTMLMLVLESAQSNTCNIYVRRGESVVHSKKPAHNKQWTQTMHGLTTILAGFPNMSQPSVYVWFNEIAGICSEAPNLSASAEIVDLETPTLSSIAEFCEKNARMLELSGPRMKRHYVNSGTTVRMAPKDLIDILQNGENGEEYLSRLREKLSALHMSDAASLLFPTPACLVKDHLIMSFQSSGSKTISKLVSQGPQWRYPSIFVGLLIVASAAAVAGVSRWKTLPPWIPSSKTSTKDGSYIKLFDDEINHCPTCSAA